MHLCFDSLGIQQLTSKPDKAPLHLSSTTPYYHVVVFLPPLPLLLGGDFTAFRKTDHLLLRGDLLAVSGLPAVGIVDAWTEDALFSGEPVFATNSALAGDTDDGSFFLTFFPLL